ncbi:LCP family protein [Isoptericola sp. 178]|uniref:LCP family protein n=1 Tax=Isoptericola sp. 178 TaxID=3064651 RepID=UPI0027143BCA|nr:LCP family protein [Isoptericola sp. 178]MDO8144108.1 LCP family protein [Isoptericola sp. 178]
MTYPPARHIAPRDGSATGPAHARTQQGTSILRLGALVMTAVLAFVGVGAATAAVTLSGNIAAIDADAALGEDRPEKVVPDDPNAGAPLNILLLGSDSREGNNGNDDGTEGARADTTMIMHLAADRSRVELMSIPRDTTTDIPSCPTSSGGETPPLYGVKFNAAFSQGYDYGHDVESGALCTMKTVETISDVRMDGFVVVDFSGFRNMIDALGGVEMCIPNDIDAPKADNLVLSAGVQNLDGKTALQYARARTGQGLGDGSDIGRIARQQEMMAALARTVLEQNMLTDSARLLQFLGATTGSLTMSSNFASVQGLAGLAYSARGVRPGNIAFMTVPWHYDPDNPANVVLDAEAASVWDDLRHDRPLSEVVAGADESGSTAGDGDGGSSEGGSSDGGSGTPEGDAAAGSDVTTTSATDSGADGSGGSTATPSDEPSPGQTRDPREEAFTGADVTAVCEG